MTQVNRSVSEMSDFEDADRGYVGTLDDPVITDADGREVWNLAAYDFLQGPYPDTAHPGLWRQGQLCARQGLYEVTEGVYQVRGFDASNMTLIEGNRGVVVVDPLISAEVAAAGLDLYREHRGDRPVSGVVYTHSHIDHFGGVYGVTSDDAGVPIIAPTGFLEHAVSENVYAGSAMTRRSVYMYGQTLPRSGTAQIGVGLGQATSTGHQGLIAPTLDITATGQQETVDGVRMEFQLTPDTEAPAEMNFLLPERRALCMAENATHNLHNLLTLRGAQVRDAHGWARYLNEAITRFSGRADVLFASHHWPTWGQEQMVTFLCQQRDLYAYLHDQTLRLMNQGLTGLEIAETITIPPGLANEWNTRGYYGSVSHNVKAIYQRYLGWYDGHPSSLWEHPPVESARRYVETIGGQAQVVERARGYADAGDLRFAAQLLKHAVFNEPTDRAATDLLAGVYQRLGYGAENGTWRNIYLTGASELRDGVIPQPYTVGSASTLSALTVEQVFDSVAIRVDGPRAWNVQLTIDWTITDVGRTYRTTMSNGVLIPEPDPTGGEADLHATLTKAQLLAVLEGGNLDDVEYTGDPGTLATLLGLLDEPDVNFSIVTP